MTSHRPAREISLDLPPSAELRRVRAELDALLMAAAHVVDLTERGGTSLLVGGAIRALGEVVDRVRAASTVDGRGRPGTVRHAGVTE